MEVLVEELRGLRLEMANLSRIIVKFRVASTLTESAPPFMVVDLPETMESGSVGSDNFLPALGICVLLWFVGCVVVAQAIMLWKHNVPPILVSHKMKCFFFFSYLNVRSPFVELLSSSAHTGYQTVL